MKFRNTAELEQTLGYQFLRPELLEQALTHSSQARETELTSASPGTRAADNEQLEFLGDAVLGLITTEELFLRFPHFREGALSKLRAHLVSEKHLIRVAQRFDLGQFLRLGRGEEKSGGRHKTAMLVDALEAVLGAMYIDGGLEIVRRVVVAHVIAPELERISRNGSSLPLTDFKSALQEKLQAVGRPQPLYVLVNEQGPEHSKTFTVEARLASGDPAKPEFVGRAQGSTKKNAEQGAAQQLLDHLCSSLVEVPSRVQSRRPFPEKS
ncbi:MAG TPA: ribonuclease III [Terriglobales bacterium]|nr:ribonuclease III [Terriglobales bacterium]HXY13785.1 ribonuclease III [Terriglobales bacterium]